MSKVCMCVCVYVCGEGIQFCLETGNRQVIYCSYPGGSSNELFYKCTSKSFTVLITSCMHLDELPLVPP